jgi:hypothetical protein
MERSNTSRAMSAVPQRMVPNPSKFLTRPPSGPRPQPLGGKRRIDSPSWPEQPIKMSGTAPKKRHRLIKPRKETTP